MIADIMDWVSVNWQASTSGDLRKSDDRILTTIHMR